MKKERRMQQKQIGPIRRQYGKGPIFLQSAAVFFCWKNGSVVKKMERCSADEKPSVLQRSIKDSAYCHSFSGRS
ncbi:MAG: hypothetical protein Q4B90_03870 [Eubacteriales bacterium]|nr:hypothetical protein [Eubacteriales bacterium]